MLTFGYSEVQASFSLFFDYLYPTDQASILCIGTVNEARSPLEDMVTERPGAEITYALHGFTSHVSGFWDGPGPDVEWGGMLYWFYDGYFRVYADDSPDLDFEDPSTFQDGELLLEANVPEFWLISGAGYPCPGCYPAHGADVEFTGGTLFSRVNRDGVGFNGRIGQSAAGLGSIDSLEYPGTSFPSRGKMWLSIPVSVDKTTWGRLKLLYAP